MHQGYGRIFYGGPPGSCVPLPMPWFAEPCTGLFITGDIFLGKNRLHEDVCGAHYRRPDRIMLEEAFIANPGLLSLILTGKALVEGSA